MLLIHSLGVKMHQLNQNPWSQLIPSPKNLVFALCCVVSCRRDSCHIESPLEWDRFVKNQPHIEYVRAHPARLIRCSNLFVYFASLLPTVYQPISTKLHLSRRRESPLLER